jgi:hypothetical protein
VSQPAVLAGSVLLYVDGVFAINEHVQSHVDTNARTEGSGNSLHGILDTGNWVVQLATEVQAFDRVGSAFPPS